jgi:hypothetical protein
VYSIKGSCNFGWQLDSGLKPLEQRNAYAAAVCVMVKNMPIKKQRLAAPPAAAAVKTVCFSIARALVVASVGAKAASRPLRLANRRTLHRARRSDTSTPGHIQIFFMRAPY